ncbi:hypothetical protein BFP97_17790 [Roseivirga sp. 4D4]|nr:hypothetical protein BFP97_17790 [Roseivirga sp. 4D4]
MAPLASSSDFQSWVKSYRKNICQTVLEVVLFKYFIEMKIDNYPRLQKLQVITNELCEVDIRI